MSLLDGTRAGLHTFNMNISKASWQIIITFHLEYHWGGEMPVSGLGPDQFRTLISMATDSSHRVIMGKIL